MDLKNRKYEVGDRVLCKRDVKEVTYVDSKGFRLGTKSDIIPWALQRDYPLMYIPNKEVENDDESLELYKEFHKDQIIQNIKETGSAIARSFFDFPDPRTFVDVQEKNQTFGEAMANFEKGWGIKVPEWKGYWWLQGGEIWVRLEDGSKSNTPWYHQNVLRQDWQSGPIKPDRMSDQELMEAFSK